MGDTRDIRAEAKNRKTVLDLDFLDPFNWSTNGVLRLLACGPRNLAQGSRISNFNVEKVSILLQDTREKREIFELRHRIDKSFEILDLCTHSIGQLTGIWLFLVSVLSSSSEIRPDRNFIEFRSEVASRMGRSGRARRTLPKAPKKMGFWVPKV